MRRQLQGLGASSSPVQNWSQVSGLKDSEGFAAKWLATLKLHRGSCAGGWVSWSSSKSPRSGQPCADDAWLPKLPGTSKIDFCNFIPVSGP